MEQILHETPGQGTPSAWLPDGGVRHTPTIQPRPESTGQWIDNGAKARVRLASPRP